MAPHPVQVRRSSCIVSLMVQGRGLKIVRMVRATHLTAVQMVHPTALIRRACTIDTLLLTALQMRVALQNRRMLAEDHGGAPLCR